MTFVGFDLHKRYITACAMDASGAIIAEIRGGPSPEAYKGAGSCYVEFGHDLVGHEAEQADDVIGGCGQAGLLRRSRRMSGIVSAQAAV